MPPSPVLLLLCCCSLPASQHLHRSLHRPLHGASLAQLPTRTSASSSTCCLAGALLPLARLPHSEVRQQRPGQQPVLRVRQYRRYKLKYNQTVQLSTVMQYMRTQASTRKTAMCVCVWGGGRARQTEHHIFIMMRDGPDAGLRAPVTSISSPPHPRATQPSGSFPPTRRTAPSAATDAHYCTLDYTTTQHHTTPPCTMHARLTMSTSPCLASVTTQG